MTQNSTLSKVRRSSHDVQMYGQVDMPRMLPGARLSCERARDLTMVKCILLALLCVSILLSQCVMHRLRRWEVRLESVINAIPGME
jgi:hypothetical protein